MKRALRMVPSFAIQCLQAAVETRIRFIEFGDGDALVEFFVVLRQRARIREIHPPSGTEPVGDGTVPARRDRGRFRFHSERVVPGFNQRAELFVRIRFAIMDRKRHGRATRASRRTISKSGRCRARSEIARGASRCEHGSCFMAGNGSICKTCQATTWRAHSCVQRSHLCERLELIWCSEECELVIVSRR